MINAFASLAVIVRDSRGDGDHIDHRRKSQSNLVDSPMAKRGIASDRASVGVGRDHPCRALADCFDFFTVSRAARVGIGEAAARWSIFYVALAVAFGIGVYYFMGSQSGTEFFTAYLVERASRSTTCSSSRSSLAQFAVPSILQQRVLLIGIVLALIFRAVFIAIGAAALSAFAFTFIIFGALLIWTGITTRSTPQRGSAALGQLPGENGPANVIRSLMITTERQCSSVRPGKRVAHSDAPGDHRDRGSDRICCLRLTRFRQPSASRNAYLVFTANAFALFGLRALYFYLGLA